MIKIAAVVTGMLVLAGSARAQQPPAVQPLPAEPSVAAANRAVLSQLPFQDRQDFEDANRGFIATSAAGHNPDVYGFLAQDAPPTVNPSLWRQAQLNEINGLFKVADGVYQVRGFSLANMTIVEGASGVIVIDTLQTVGGARAAIDLYFAHRPRRPVVAVIYTHSHADHYGGVKGVASEADVAAGRTKVYAPAGFMKEVVSESVIAGNAMARRAQYQFGVPLPRSARGNVDAGLGHDARDPSGASLIAPTDSIEQSIETRTIDGVTMVFQLAPSTEAPAEMHIFLPQSRVLDMAENVTHTLHNLLPLRGTEIRDAKSWSRLINDALDRFGSEAQVLIAQHHWPVWGRDRVTERLTNHRDLYKYVHDQSVRMMNLGYSPAEIAESLTMPPGLENDWSARGYYGTLSHDAKSVYQRYLGWYDGNPADLNPLPPVESAKKSVEYMGGAAAVLARAREDYTAGHYRWVAQVAEQVVYADPANAEARALAAQAFEQLGYLAESATWRNAYLLGAQELRRVAAPLRRVPGAGADMLHAMDAGLLFDHLGTRVNGPRAGTARIVINWHFTDTKESAASTLSHGALTAIIGKDAANADATVTVPRAVLEAVILRQRTIDDVIATRDATITGNTGRLTQLIGVLDDFDAAFPLIEPRR